MIDTQKQPTSSKSVAGSLKQRTYADIVEFLDKHWSLAPYDEKTLERTKALDTALGKPSQKIPTILVAGTNGKSLTAHFTAQLLQAEGLKVGIFSAPHTLTYNERFTINRETIGNKPFTDAANEVISLAEQMGIKATTQELLVMMALQYFASQALDVVLLEVDREGTYNPAAICPAKIAIITRVTPPTTTTDDAALLTMARDLMGIVREGTHVVSGDQSKIHLHLMQEITRTVKAQWAMPIRKLAPLGYPFEQMHGRCAALAERASQLFVEKCLTGHVTVLTDSLLTRQKGQRGRPTLEEKRRAELFPKKTLEQFWKETTNELPCRFQLLDKEKPSILLDNASNVDAFKNLLLGIRLLHYQRPLKGLTIIIGAAHNTLNCDEFLKLLRYFFKKTSGQLLICPLETPVPGSGETTSWDIEQVTNDVKAMKIKARACKSFEEALEMGKKSVDERNGLVVITGSESIIHHYWKQKGIKKL